MTDMKKQSAALRCAGLFALAGPLAGALAGVLALATSAAAHPHAPGEGHRWVHENGVGPDPDGDSNPATDTRVIPFIGEWRTSDDGRLYPVISFEPPPGQHTEAIRTDFAGEFGVTFGPGLSWQVCDGQRHFQYDSMCTYPGATSGKFAAGYMDYLNRPLTIEFAEPVCLVTMAIYPTGAKADEPFAFAIEGWDEAGHRIARAEERFSWNPMTVRWNNVAGAYFVDRPAKRITVAMRSEDALERDETLRYLIDDLAFLSGDCQTAAEAIDEASTVGIGNRLRRLNRSEPP